MNMSNLINNIRSTPDCIIYPPVGLPSIQEGHVLPDDLHEFYEMCGGMDLFTSEPFSISIVPPEKLVLANPVIISNWTESEMKQDTEDEPSWSWHIIAEAANSQYITIDLIAERLGQCYDIFWEIHPADSTIVANSFTDLLIRLLANRGHHWYWLEPGFEFPNPV